MTAQMFVQITALLFIEVEVLIDALRLAQSFERAADLLRRPIRLQKGFDLLPNFKGDAADVNGGTRWF